MRIEGLSAVVPDRVVTNDEMIDLVRQNSRATFEGDLEGTLANVGFFFEHSGIRSRRWLRPSEAWFPHTERAIDQALQEAGIGRGDVDLLIFAGLDKRVAEPGHAFFLAKALGIPHTQCFDVTEGCGSWTRAVYLASALLKTGLHRRILVVTGEFGMHEGERLSHNWSLRRADDLAWAFSAYTFGESSTAVVLTRDDDNDWGFRFSTHADCADLCMLPLDDYSEAMGTLDTVSLQGRGGGRFVAYGKEMLQASDAPIRQLFTRWTDRPDAWKVVLPHTHTRRYWDDLAGSLGVQVPWHYVYPKYGNVVTGSIATGLDDARKAGRIGRGDPVFVMMASAGFVFSTYTFEL